MIRSTGALAGLTRAAAVGALVLLGACGSREPEPTSAVLRDEAHRLAPVDDGQFRAAIDRFRQYNGVDVAERGVIRDQQSWQAFWQRVTARQTPQGPLPAVDFSSHMVVFTALGSRPNGGYSVLIDGVYEEGDSLEVDVLASVPGDDCVTTQAITAPLDAVLLPRRALPVVFRQQERTRDCR